MTRFLSISVGAMFVLLAGCGSSDKSTTGTSTTAKVAKASTTTVLLAPQPCSTRSLSLAANAPYVKEGTVDQYAIQLSLKNNARQACLLNGSPVVVVNGPNTAIGSMYNVHYQENIQSSLVTLKTDEKAVFTLTYLRGTAESAVCNGGVPWKPTKIAVTVPKSEGTLSVNWPGDTIDNCQGAATHPGDYVSPFTNG